MRFCDLKITVLPHLGLAAATPRFHVRFVSPPNVVPPKPRSASSEAFGRPVTLPRQDGPLLLGHPLRGCPAGRRASVFGRVAPHRSEKTRAVIRPRSMTDLEVENLACRRGGRPVFGNLSFSLRQGELLALTGRN